MSRTLSTSAERLGCSERTLRRYVNDGLLRGRRVARRRLELSSAEEEYLAAHWELLSKLRTALRTERAARMVVLFGSTATGEDEDSSDVDLLVAYSEEGPRPLARLQIRLRRALEQPVDVVGLEQAEMMPTLLADILREGRVLVDRDGLWEGLQERRREVSAAAEREEREVARRAHETVVAARERIAAAV
ncbi:MAG TPA: nucleotidyltransferase domain-containing protein [Solirubrobacteraceae bacterium]